MRASMIFHSWSLQVALKEQLAAKSSPPSTLRNPPEIFCFAFGVLRNLHSGKLLVNGTATSVSKRERPPLKLGRHMARLCPTRCFSRPRFFLPEGRGDSKGGSASWCPPRRQCIMATADESDQRWGKFERFSLIFFVSPMRKIDHMAGVARPAHLGRPILLLDFGQSFEFAPVMGTREGHLVFRNTASRDRAPRSCLSSHSSACLRVSCRRDRGRVLRRRRHAANGSCH